MRTARPLALVVMLTFLAGCLGTGPAGDGTPNDPSASTQPTADIGIPWNIDDHWVQRVYYEDQPEGSLQMLDYNVETIDDLGGTPALRIVGDDSPRKYWVRASDGALLKESDDGSEKKHEPPCEAFIADFTEGATKTHDCYRVGTRGPNASASDTGFTTTVKGTEKITIPPGTFDVVRLETTRNGRLVLTEYFSEQLCFPARVAIPEGDRTIVLELVTYACEG